MKSRKKRRQTLEKLRQQQTEQQYDYLTERHIVKPSHSHFPVLVHYAHLANNVYNQGLYRVRQALFDGHWMTYGQLNTSLKQSKEQRDCMLYSSMHSVHLVQQVLKLVAQNMESWRKARKAYAKNPSKFTGCPRLPKYLKKGGMTSFVVDNQTAKLRQPDKKTGRRFVEIPVLNNFKIELQHLETDKIQQVRIIPENGCFVVEVVYKTNQTINYKPDNHRYLTIDPGLDNAFTLATNVPGIQPVIINGQPLKAINQYYNKRRAELSQILDLANLPKTSHRLDRLDFYRNQKVMAFAHEASKRIVKFALSHELNTIIIGKNKGQKRSINMGKRNNQNFIGIPHQKIIEMIKYKANLVGIAVIQHNEAYTSQTSFLDGEAPVNSNGNKARKRRGLSPAKRRIKRGLFRSNNGTLINADVNGALQILRKVVPNAFADGIEGIGLCPVKLNLSF